jgi:hypothetical protein
LYGLNNSAQAISLNGAPIIVEAKLRVDQFFFQATIRSFAASD